jgi:ribonuclease HI
MKRLKFNHGLAELIRAGKKTSTFRMYDDKDLSVNDEIELIDKVDAKSPATWVSIGHARIDSVIEKRLGNINDDDLKRYEAFASRDDMLKTYRQYYGDQITFDMPVKVIQFSLMQNKSVSTTDDKSTAVITEVDLYADGGSRGNPGPSASGYAIMDSEGRILTKRGIYLGVTTNNQAEYLALKLGLEEVQKMHVGKVHVYMDSLLVVNQMLGIFKIKNRDLWPMHDAVKQIAQSFDHITFTHVPRLLNKVADAAVNEALDAAARSA